MRGYVERHKLIEYKCDTCGCTGEWQDGFISLELDHKDGNNKNNKISNLHYLCPNCHALTETYRGKNKETYKNIPVDEKSFVEALQTTPNIRQALIKLNLSPAGANYSRAKELLNKYQIIQKDI
nr:MAG TPA: NinG recombination protein [Caudoviricetes sp.]